MMTSTGMSIVDEPVPITPLSKPAINPTLRTSRQPTPPPVIFNRPVDYLDQSTWSSARVRALRLRNRLMLIALVRVVDLEFATSTGAGSGYQQQGQQ
jgi:hypothetical protein